MSADWRKNELARRAQVFNPIASVKDRIGVAMINTLEAAGKITPGKSVLMRPTWAIPASRSNWRHRAATG